VHPVSLYCSSFRYDNIANRFIALGPVVGGFAVQGKGWTWTAWVTMWHAAFVLIVLFCFLPETSSHHILYRRARRLRKLTGNDRLTCHDQLEHADNSWKDLAVGTLITPFTLNTEPIVFSINLYVALIYALLYTWLESFEIVFGEKYGMGLGEESLTFLGIFVGGLVSLPPLIWYSRHHLEPEYSEEDEIEPEKLLGPAKVGGFFIPACLFIFGWTAQYKAPWIAPVIGSGLFGVANNMILVSKLHTRLLVSSL
jgi:DHA1 family multidrug resistance protein-like MFS transporter